MTAAEKTVDVSPLPPLGPKAAPAASTVASLDAKPANEIEPFEPRPIDLLEAWLIENPEGNRREAAERFNVNPTAASELAARLIREGAIPGLKRLSRRPEIPAGFLPTRSAYEFLGVGPDHFQILKHGDSTRTPRISAAGKAGFKNVDLYRIDELETLKSQLAAEASEKRAERARLRVEREGARLAEKRERRTARREAEPDRLARLAAGRRRFLGDTVPFTPSMAKAGLSDSSPSPEPHDGPIDLQALGVRVHHESSNEIEVEIAEPLINRAPIERSKKKKPFSGTTIAVPARHPIGPSPEKVARDRSRAELLRTIDPTLIKRLPSAFDVRTNYLSGKARFDEETRLIEAARPEKKFVSGMTPEERRDLDRDERKMLARASLVAAAKRSQ